MYTSSTGSCSCTATTTSPQGVTTNLLLTGAVVSAATPDLLTITLKGASAAGNTIIVSCDTTNMGNNPIANHYITFDLEVTNHNKVYKRKGWTATAA